MPTKGKLRRMTSKKPYDIYKKAVLRKTTRERKKRKISQAVQRETPLRSRFSFSLSVLLRRVLVWRSEATPLVIDKHTPICQKYFMLYCSKFFIRFVMICLSLLFNFRKINNNSVSSSDRTSIFSLSLKN